MHYPLIRHVTGSFDVSSAPVKVGVKRHGPQDEIPADDAFGRSTAQAMLHEYFEPEDAMWRGIGVIPGSGLKLRPRFANRDAVARFGLERPEVEEPKACQCGEVLKGIKLPPECKLFGKACTPDKPVGACMVSTEGSCAAYFKYQSEE